VAGYTRVNLKEVEDSARKYDMPAEMETHFAGGDLETEKSGLSYQRYGSNFRQPFGHKHKTQEEIYVILEGSGKMALDDEIIEVSEYDAVRVPPETMRCFEGGPDGIGYLAIGAYGGTSSANDAEQVPNWWPE
jgi:mannose-6-phosphate isomerase-like protein (cupin superfamily)